MTSPKPKLNLKSGSASEETKFHKLTISELTSRLHKAQQKISSDNTTKKPATSVVSPRNSLKSAVSPSTKASQAAPQAKKPATPQFKSPQPAKKESTNGNTLNISATLKALDISGALKRLTPSPSQPAKDKLVSKQPSQSPKKEMPKGRSSDISLNLKKLGPSPSMPSMDKLTQNSPRSPRKEPASGSDTSRSLKVVTSAPSMSAIDKLMPKKSLSPKQPVKKADLSASLTSKATTSSSPQLTPSSPQQAPPSPQQASSTPQQAPPTPQPAQPSPQPGQSTPQPAQSSPQPPPSPLLTPTTPQSAQPSMPQQRISEDPQTKFDSMALPLSAPVAYRLFKYFLSTFEHTEILEYKEIYCLGLKCQKLQTYGVSFNNGFDDENGDYNVVIGDHLGYRYEVIEILGKGSFGQVVKVFDNKLKEFLAMKIIRNKVKFTKQAEDEVRILKLVRDNDPKDSYNVVHMKDFFMFRKHLCMGFEVLSSNLYDLLKTANFGGVNISIVRKIGFQIVQALKLLKTLDLIHCDLKPENILLKPDGSNDIKLIDFGSACFVNGKVFTYIQSRFYRAPEIVLGVDYNEAIDIWSLGCIIFELYTGYPLFPGENETDLLLCMMEVLGIPPEKFLEKASRKRMFFDARNAPRIVPNSRGKKRNPGSKSIPELLAGAEPHFINFVERCLTWYPNNRLTVDEAVSHPFFKEPIKRVRSQRPNPNNLNHNRKTSLGDHNPAPALKYNPLFPKNTPHTTKAADKGFTFN
ncbi:DYRK4_3 [Blepharisma stoltei]|uniref:dual-specificity kinase n=1 Tax=Blepharisma stoltei TaxID=1481888 RepID=A0AAU9IHW4_9CILI|nr:unnamed protein product [Blepharisma stoltei]